MILNNQMINFIKIGLLNTMFYYIIYSSLIYINLGYKLSVLIATMVGVIFSFKTFGKFVFNNEDKSIIFKFISVYILLYFININIISILYDYSINYYISGLFATLCCAVLSFILNKWYVFKNEEQNE